MTTDPNSTAPDDTQPTLQVPEALRAWAKAQFGQEFHSGDELADMLDLLAAQLRTVALLPPARMQIQIDLFGKKSDEADRIAAVDSVSALVGLSASREEGHGSYWPYRGGELNHNFAVTAFLDPPAAPLTPRQVEEKLQEWLSGLPSMPEPDDIEVIPGYRHLSLEVAATEDVDRWAGLLAATAIRSGSRSCSYGFEDHGTHTDLPGWTVYVWCSVASAEPVSA